MSGHTIKAIDTKFMLRPGTSEISDAIHYARLTNTAAGGGYTFLYGARWEEVLIHLYRQEDTTHSYRHTCFVCRNNDVVGHIVFISYDDFRLYHPLTHSITRAHLGWRRHRFAVALFLRKMLGIRIGEVYPGEMHLGAIAIYKKWRGQHLSAHLLGVAETAARVQGCERLSVDVSSRNVVSIRMCQKAGFRIVEEQQKKKPRVYRMLLDL